MSDEDRHSIAAQPSFISDPIEEAKRESENAVAQFDRVLDLIDEVVRDGRSFRLRPSIILDLHRIALDGLSSYAGNFRPADVSIGQSRHTPPGARRERWPITFCAPRSATACPAMKRFPNRLPVIRGRITRRWKKRTDIGNSESSISPPWRNCSTSASRNNCYRLTRTRRIQTRGRRKSASCIKPFSNSGHKFRGHYTHWLFLAFRVRRCWRGPVAWPRRRR